jgi:hypothetical protein
MSLRGLLARLRAAFDGVGVPFVIGGSFALAACGVPRLTRDVDVMVIAPDLTPVHRAMQAARFEWINEVTFRDDETGLLVDIIPIEDAAQRHAFESAVLTPFDGGVEVRTLTAEGCCIMLLREATIGEPKRWPLRLRDIEALALVTPLRWDEIASWARRMDYAVAYADIRAAGRPPM